MIKCSLSFRNDGIICVKIKESKRNKVLPGCGEAGVLLIALHNYIGDKYGEEAAALHVKAITEFEESINKNKEAENE